MPTPEQMVCMLDEFAAHCDENARALNAPQSDGKPAKFECQHAAMRLKLVADTVEGLTKIIMSELLPGVTINSNQ